MPLKPDAEKYNAPRHFGHDLLASSGADQSEIQPVNKPSLRRVGSQSGIRGMTIIMDEASDISPVEWEKMIRQLGSS